MAELNGASVLIAGASGGIGSALAAELIERGCRLGLFARDADRLEDLPVDGVRIAGDIRNTDDCERAVQRVLDARGRLDGLINAAGVVAFGMLTDTDDDVLEQMFATNVLGPLRLIRAGLPHMKTGFIVNISAIVVERPMPGMVAYCAAKGALASATAALQREVKLRSRDVHLIDARPPHTETGLADRPLAGTPPKLPKGLEARQVAERIVAAIEADEPEIPSKAFLAGRRDKHAQ
jgi:cyclic-di-GMP-binding biofilm dispersal mediator protein